MLPQAADLDPGLEVHAVQKHAIRMLAALLLYALVWNSQATAAEPFVEALADTSVIKAEQRLRASGDAVEWVRRVRVNEVALAAEEITVNLYDVVLHLSRDPAVPVLKLRKRLYTAPLVRRVSIARLSPCPACSGRERSKVRPRMQTLSPASRSA